MDEVIITTDQPSTAAAVANLPRQVHLPCGKSTANLEVTAAAEVQEATGNFGQAALPGLLLLTEFSPGLSHRRGMGKALIARQISLTGRDPL